MGKDCKSTLALPLNETDGGCDELVLGSIVRVSSLEDQPEMLARDSEMGDMSL